MGAKAKNHIMFKSFCSFAALCFCLILLTACSVLQAAENTNKDPNMAALHPGHGSLAGSIDRKTLPKPGEDYYVFAAKYIDINSDGGVYLFDLNDGPEAKIDSKGNFELVNIPTGSYVLTVGRYPEEAVRIVNDERKVRVVEVKPGETNNLGHLRSTK
jgi:hypothetical protein